VTPEGSRGGPRAGSTWPPLADIQLICSDGLPGYATKRKRGGKADRGRGWSIEGLPARGPDAELRDKLQLFGQFVGDWDIVEHRTPLTRIQPAGEVHFNWILGGRAVQDVWGAADPRTGRLIPLGTTVRYYDPDLGAWRSTWIAPRQNTVRRFIGKKVGDRIVLQEENRGLRTERWVFADITPDSFRWFALRRQQAGGPWRMVEEMHIRRHVGPHRRTRPSSRSSRPR
jgi:hypothetical protein